MNKIKVFKFPLWEKVQYAICSRFTTEDIEDTVNEFICSVKVIDMQVTNVTDPKEGICLYYTIVYEDSEV